MKKIFLIATFFLAISLETFAAPRIILEDNKDNYTQTETGYILNVKLICTPEELVAINAEVQNYSDRLAVEVAEGSNGTYDFLVTVQHQNQPEYIYKMLMAIGISDLEYKGEIKSLDAIVEILYSYQ